MAEFLRRVREPAAWLLLGVTALYLVLDLIRFGWNLGHQHLGLAAAARQTGNSVGLVWVLLDLGIVLCCVLISPPVRRGRAVTLSAAVLVSVVAVYDLFLLITGIVGGGSAFGRVLEAIGGFLEVLCKAFVAGVLWRVAVWFRERGAELYATARADDRSSDPLPGTEPVWRRDEAVAMTWDRAGDAASGAPGAAGEHGAEERSGEPGQQQGPQQNWSRGGGRSLSALDDGFAGPGTGPIRANAPWASAAEQAAGLTPEPPEGAERPGATESGDDSGRPRWTPLPPDEK